MSQSQYLIWKHNRSFRQYAWRDCPVQLVNEEWKYFDDRAAQQKHLPWLKWGLMESLSQEGRSQSWSGWTHFSWVTWTCRSHLHWPISETQEYSEQAVHFITKQKKRTTDVLHVIWVDHCDCSDSPQLSRHWWPPVCTVCRTTLLSCRFALQMTLTPLQLWRKKNDRHITWIHYKTSLSELIRYSESVTTGQDEIWVLFY